MSIFIGPEYLKTLDLCSSWDISAGKVPLQKQLLEIANINLGGFQRMIMESKFGRTYPVKTAETRNFALVLGCDDIAAEVGCVG